MSRKRTVMATAAALATALVLAACGTSGSSGGGTTLKIGFMGDLTGENAGIVVPPRNGAKLAIDQYNATNPGTKLELVEYDSQGSATQATPLATKAIQQDKITGLIGPAFSGESKAVGPILEQGKIPSVSPSATNPGLAQNGWKYWHRVVANDDDQGPAITNFLITAKSPKSAFVISDDQAYSVGIADASFKTFQAKGITVGRDQFAQKAPEYSSTVAKVKAANPDVIFYGGYYAQAGKLLKQLRDGGVTATFATGDGSLDPGLVSGAGQAAAEGAVVGCPCAIPSADTTSDALKKFFGDYKSAFNTDPAIYAVEGYDSATAFINAVKAGNTTSDAINNYLATINFVGLSKPIKFKPNGEIEANQIFVYVVKAGKITLLGPSTEAKLS
ncbi:MAG: livK [Pseudonocardia sp.]|jgi:branched-chain amino acid transport system substrate-binding protein|nr:livK [Pseudonocardia sp.]